MDSVKESLLQRFNTHFKVRYLGLGFLWAWIYCSWFTPVLFEHSSGLTINNDVSWTISLALVTVSLFVSPFVFKRDLLSFQWVRWAAPIGTAIGAVAMASQPIFGIDIEWIRFVGAALTGIASGWLWIMWGEFFGLVDLEITEFILPLTVAVPLIFMITTLFAQGPLAGFAICCLPLISGMCLVFSLTDKTTIKPVPVRELPTKERGSAYLWDFLKIGIGSCAVYAAISFCWSCIPFDTDGLWSGWYIVAYSIGGVAAIVTGILTFLYSSRKNMFNMYRWLVPIILFAFAGLSVANFGGRLVSFALVTTAQYGFDIIVWVYFSSIVRKGVCSSRVAAGINRGFVQLGVLTGSLIGTGALAWDGEGILPLYSVMLILVAVMVAIVLFVFANRDQIETSAYAVSEGSEGESSFFETLEHLAGSHGLTKREHEVFTLLARGRSIPYISDALFISKNTVESHVKSIYRKFDVHARQELLDLLEDEEASP